MARPIAADTPRFREILLALVLAAFMAASLLVLMTIRPAEAAFPGANGKIAFSSNRVTGDGVDNPTGLNEIFTMNPDGTGVTQLTKSTGNDEQPAWSPDGTKIAFRSERDGNFEVYVMDAVDSDGDGNGDNPTRLTTSTSIVGSDDLAPAWSPDGTKIAFQRSLTGNYEICVMDARDEVNGTGDPGPDGNGDNLTCLTENDNDDIEPAWSPLGTKIAFISQRSTATNPTGDYEIFTMNSDGSNQVQRTKNTASDEAPNWSPGGRKIAFSSDRAAATNPTDDYEIFTMRANGERQKNRTRNDVNDIEPAWSPSGTRIVFQSDEEGNPEIFTMRADGTGRTNISNTANAKDINNNPAEDINPDWQPIAN